MENSVLILMATYNGEVYLRKQIDSIIAQTHTNWKLLIQDDGSTDGTLEILREYEQKDPRIEVLINNGQLHGPYHNFHELFCEAKKRPPYTYYAFCDQDDIWKKEKLEKLTKYCSDNAQEGEPVFVHSDLAVIDAEDRVIEQSVNQILGVDISDNPVNLFFVHGYVWGCASLFNHALFELVPSLNSDFTHRDIMSHDNYIAKHAVMYGKLLFYPVPMILYRKHGGNVTDSHKFRLSPMMVFRKAVFGFHDVCRIHAKVYNQSLLALNVMNKEPQYSSIADKVKKIEAIIRVGGIKGVHGLYKFNVHRKQFSRSFALYFIMLIGAYKKYLFK